MKKSWSIGKEIARVAHSRFDILEVLYPDKEYTLTELSARTGTEIGNLSKQINGTKKTIGLKDFELPSGEVLIEVREQARERGRPLKCIKLTEAGRRIVSPFIESMKPQPEKKGPADIEQIDFYLDEMERRSNDEILKTASEEFMRICEEHVVTHHERILQFLKERITDPQYEIVHLNLLSSLHKMVQNTGDEKALSILKRDFKKPLKEIAEDMTLEQSGAGSTIRLYAIETLCDILEDEDKFQELLKLYIDGITRRSGLIEDIRRMIRSAYPEREFEVKKALFRMLEDPSEDIRKCFRNQIRELRRPFRRHSSDRATFA
jgi:DNA-binding Xre family transcriptional regulator